MKRYFFLLINICVVFCAIAGQSEAVLLKIGGKDVTRQEFECLYNKHCLSTKASPKTPIEYLESYINLKLKVLEAETCGYDTMQSFKDDLSDYQAKLVSSQGKESIDGTYDLLGNEVRVAHIFKHLPQDVSGRDIAKAVTLMDSLYMCLQNGADFAELARKYSDDKETAAKGGTLSWFTINRKIKELENAAFFSNLTVGDYTAPFMSPAGCHILKMLGRRGTVLSDAGWNYSLQEYYDAVLSTKMDSEILYLSDKTADLFFEENKSDYEWSVPRFKGVILYAKDKKRFKEIKKILKKLPKDEWVKVLEDMRKKDESPDFDASGILFSEGDNVNIDKVIFKKGELKPVAGYPYMTAIGKKIKRPESYKDVFEAVIPDYKKCIENAWIKTLRNKYKVEINQEVLKTVNNH